MNNHLQAIQTPYCTEKQSKKGCNNLQKIFKDHYNFSVQRILEDMNEFWTEHRTMRDKNTVYS